MLCFNFNNRFTKTIVNFTRHFCCRVVAKREGAYASGLPQRTSYEVVWYLSSRCRFCQNMCFYILESNRNPLRK